MLGARESGQEFLPRNTNLVSLKADSIQSLYNQLASAAEDSDGEYNPYESVPIFQLCMANLLPDDEFFAGKDIIIHANLNHMCVDSHMQYAISDGGADSCILEKGVLVLRTSGIYTRLQGYDSTASASRRIEIVIGANNTIDTNGNYIIYIAHEALPESDTTLFSEYQMRDQGIVVDYCASNYVLSHNPPTYGT